jgi:hypothetical protein
MVLLVLLLASASEAHAQQFLSTGRDTLRGLPGVEMLVEPLAPPLEQAGLAASAIRTNIEQQLRAGGVRLYASQNDNPSPAKAYLYLHVSGISLPGGGYALSLQLQLRQTLRSLVTQSAIVNAMSWDQHIVTMVPAGSGMPAVHRDVQGLVARFVEDWRTVH